MPEGIHLLALFALFPRTAADVEHFWPLTNEGVANRSFRTLDELETVQVERCALALEPTRCHPLSHPLSTLGLLLIQIITNQQDLV